MGHEDTASDFGHGARDDAERAGRRRAGHDRARFGRRAISEFAGTFALTFVAAGTEMAATLAPSEVDHVARSLAPGLVVMVFIYAFGDVSGAHFNPAVTLAFSLKGLFPWRWVPLYWVSQVSGGLAAAMTLDVLLGDIAHLGASEAHIGAGPAVALEALLAWILITVIVGTADRYRLVGTEAAIAVGAAISLCGLFAGTLTGASMNPARSLGPAAIAGFWDTQWVYVVGPLAGACLAVAFTALVHGPEAHNSQGREAAQGD